MRNKICNWSIGIQSSNQLLGFWCSDWIGTLFSVDSLATKSVIDWSVFEFVDKFIIDYLEFDKSY